MKGTSIFVALLLPGICLGKANNEGQKMYSDWFAYRPDAVLDYIKKSEPWEAGRRDILDYGTGNGLLASRLAEAGATSVTAVDISSAAVKAAQKRLEPFPSAMARGTRPLTSPPGAIGYRDRFDTVVSFKGALSEGTTSLARIDPFTEAMQCAARATREGGKVVAVDFGYNRHQTWLKLIYLASLGTLAWKNEVFRSIASWKLNLGIFLSTLPVGGLDVFLMITAQWVALLKTRIEGPLELSFWSILASICALWTMLGIPYNLLRNQNGKKQYQVYHKTMTDAGLTDIKRTNKISLFPYELLMKSDSRMKWISYGLNTAFYSANLNIYEGTKKGKERQDL